MFKSDVIATKEQLRFGISQDDVVQVIRSWFYLPQIVVISVRICRNLQQIHHICFQPTTKNRKHYICLLRGQHSKPLRNSSTF